MHFYYLDESGCTGNDLENQEQPIFVLGGVSIRDEGWNSTQEAFASTIEQYFDQQIPDYFELHAEELLSPNGEGPFAGHERQKRNALAKSLLRLLSERSHDIHLYAIDKRKLAREEFDSALPYSINTPYLVAYDYLITHINWFVKERLGRSARGMLIIDTKEEFHRDIERITHNRRFEGSAAHRVKWLVEFTYPVDSQRNPMVQLSDLVVFCPKKFLEIEGGYRSNYPGEVRKFFAECYKLINDKMPRKRLVERKGRKMNAVNQFLAAIQSKPVSRWKKRYSL